MNFRQQSFLLLKGKKFAKPPHPKKRVYNRTIIIIKRFMIELISVFLPCLSYLFRKRSKQHSLPFSSPFFARSVQRNSVISSLMGSLASILSRINQIKIYLNIFTVKKGRRKERIKQFRQRGAQPLNQLEVSDWRRRKERSSLIGQPLEPVKKYISYHPSKLRHDF